MSEDAYTNLAFDLAAVIGLIGFLGMTFTDIALLNPPATSAQAPALLMAVGISGRLFTRAVKYFRE